MGALKVGVIGGGSWATALTKIITSKDQTVNWWIRSADIIKDLQQNKRNPKYLSSVEFDTSKLNLGNDLLQTIANSDILIIAIPSAFLKDTLKDLPNDCFKNKIIVSAIKGMIAGDNLIIADFFNHYYNVPLENVVVISGPCHAEEVALEKLSYLTIASKSDNNCKAVCDLLSCGFIKTVPSDDIYGTEYGAVLKNIYALCAGICHGLGYGDNFQAVLISNAIREMKRFVDVVHPINRDINDSAYLGDLMVTAYSQFSRNRTFGAMIGKGYSVIAAQLEMNMVAEGYYATACIHNVNKKYNVPMPIAEAVYNILYQKVSAVVEIRLLTNSIN